MNDIWLICLDIDNMPLRDGPLSRLRQAPPYNKDTLQDIIHNIGGNSMTDYKGIICLYSPKINSAVQQSCSKPQRKSF